MKKSFPFQGTLTNVVAVIVGSLIGLTLGDQLPTEYQQIVLASVGLVTMLIGVGQFLKSRNILIVFASIVTGSLIGLFLGFDHLASQMERWNVPFLSSGTQEGLLVASILYCVGPMTLLGCMEEGLEGKSDLLMVKSALDGISSIFLAAGLGVGVLASAVVVLIVQGSLTASARLLKRWAVPDVVAEFSATGGVILALIGLRLIGVVVIDTLLFVPALLLAPVLAYLVHRFGKKPDSSDVASA